MNPDFIKIPSACNLTFNLLQVLFDEFEGDNSDAGSKKGVKMCEVLTMVKNLAQVRGAIEKLGYIVVSAEIIKIPEQLQHVTSDDQKKVEVLIEALEEHDDVENVGTTMKAGDD